MGNTFRQLTDEENSYLNHYLSRDLRKNGTGGGFLILTGCFFIVLMIVLETDPIALTLLVSAIALVLIGIGGYSIAQSIIKRSARREAVTISGRLRIKRIRYRSTEETRFYIDNYRIILPDGWEQYMEEGTHINAAGVVFTLPHLIQSFTKNGSIVLILELEGKSLVTNPRVRNSIKRKEVKNVLATAIIFFGIYGGIALGMVEHGDFKKSLNSHPLIHIAAWLAIIIPAVITIRTFFHNRRV